jgi:1-acyl-sn-glycerol-3-phosphate acyltransferase
VSILRASWRAAGFIAWTLALGGIWLCARPLLSRPFPDRRAWGGAFTLHAWSRGLCRLLGIRLEVRGVPCRGPSLRVGNHIGYLDVVVMAAASPSLFVSKDDLAGWPVLGFLGKSVGTLFLDRARPRAVAEVGEGMRALFARGQTVIMFPEGTTTAGDALQPFHSSLFEPALRAGVPVQATALSYAPRDPRDPADLAAWTGDAAFVPHLWRLLCSRGLRARLVVQEAVADHPDRRAAAAATRAWIAGVLARLRHAGGEPAPHGVGHAADLVGGLVHRAGRMRDGHRAPGLAQQRQVVGRVPDRHGF